MRYVALLAVLSAAACAQLQTEPAPLAAADCKVAPITTASAAGARPRRVDPLDQRWAEMQLASSDYRMRRLQQPLGAVNNNVEDALRDCANADAAPPATEPTPRPDASPR